MQVLKVAAIGIYIIFSSNIVTVCCQTLPSLNETIPYLDEKFLSGHIYSLNHPKDSWIEYEDVTANISVNENGKISLIRSHNSINTQSGTKVSIKTINEFYADNVIEIANAVYVSCKNEFSNCIRHFVYKDNKLVRDEYGSSFGFPYPIDLKEQTNNAFEHFLNLANAKAEIFHRSDTDPFASKNYSNSIGLGPVSAKIFKSTSDLYSLDIKIGNTTMRGYLDSGASHIVISKKLLDELISRNEVDTEQVISYSQIANGDIVATFTHNAPIITIGDAKITNITVSALENLPNILIGQSLLSKFTKWEIDHTNNLITLYRY